MSEEILGVVRFVTADVWLRTSMAFDLVFAALVASRLLLALSPLPSLLKDNTQLASPLTSFSRRTFPFSSAL
jgi:hypothetical protein